LILVFVASPLSIQHKGERAKTGWLGIRIMCQSGATWWTSVECCFSELAQYKGKIYKSSINKIHVLLPSPLAKNLIKSCLKLEDIVIHGDDRAIPWG
jgi:hypothetical protein